MRVLGLTLAALGFALALAESRIPQPVAPRTLVPIKQPSRSVGLPRSLMHAESKLELRVNPVGR
jgi:hypothetical protein